MQNNVIRLEKQYKQAVKVIEQYCGKEMPRDVVDSAIGHVHFLLIDMGETISDLPCIEGELKKAS